MQKIVFTLSLLLAVQLFPASPVSMEKADGIHGSTRITAHRGSSGDAPENTLAALIKAAEDGAGYAEIDVQETADGVVVLMHDKNAARTTGIRKNLWEIDSHELRLADAGSWFHPQFAGERVPTLEEAINTALDLKLKLNIELKNNGHSKQLAESVVRLIEQKQFIEQCVVTSFDLELLRKVKELNHRIQTGLILAPAAIVRDSTFTNPDYDIISASYLIIDKEWMERAKTEGKQVFAWTVNDQTMMKKMLELEVDSIVTDYPRQLAEAMRHTKRTSP